MGSTLLTGNSTSEGSKCEFLGSELLPDTGFSKWLTVLLQQVAEFFMSAMWLVGHASCINLRLMGWLCRDFDQKNQICANNAILHHRTLLDGEMIVDYDQQTRMYHRRFLIYDLMVWKGESYMRTAFKVME